MRWRVDSSTVLLVLRALFIVYGTLIPFRFTSDLGEVEVNLHHVADTLNGPVSRSDVVSKVLLFMPWGPSTPSTEAGGGEAGHGSASAIAASAALGGALALSIELAQLGSRVGRPGGFRSE